MRTPCALTLSLAIAAALAGGCREERPDDAPLASASASARTVPPAASALFATPYGRRPDAPVAPRPPSTDEPATTADGHLPWPAGYTPPLVWQTKKVDVDGVAEAWSLRFRKPPERNECFPYLGCACQGVEWGVVGDLELVRERPGAP